jgi:hypothetical protein
MIYLLTLLIMSIELDEQPVLEGMVFLYLL